MTLSHESLTGQILEAAFEVSNELGAGFLESVYENALCIALKDKGLKVECQIPIRVSFREQLVGVFTADMLVEDGVILELKAVKALLPEHVAQTLNYLKATGKSVALLINFGVPKLEWRRLDNKMKEQENRDKGDEGDVKKKLSVSESNAYTM